MSNSLNTSTVRTETLQSVDPTQDLYTDVAWIIETLSQSTGLSSSECHKRLVAEYRDVGHLVTQELRQRGIKSFEWSDSLAKFYEESQSFLFESLVWNSSQTKRETRRWIGSRIAQLPVKSPRVLLYGDGPGIDSLYFAWRGFQVDYFDVGQSGKTFAKNLFAKYSVPVGFPESSRIQDNHYDAIVCMDVLEHLPDPHAAVVSMKRALAADGMLFIHAPFWYLASNVSTHLRSNLRYSGDLRKLYTANGLKVVDCAPFWNPLMLQGDEATGQRVRDWKSARNLFLHGTLFSTARISPKPLAFAVKKFFGGKPTVAWSELEAFQPVPSLQR
jgi:SAM-dependent methyltransferase